MVYSVHKPVVWVVLRGCAAVNTALRSTGLSGSWSLPNEMQYGAEGHGVSCSVLVKWWNRLVYGCGKPRCVLMLVAYIPEVSVFWSM